MYKVIKYQINRNTFQSLNFTSVPIKVSLVLRVSKWLFGEPLNSDRLPPKGQATAHSIYIRTVSSQLFFIFGTFNSFLAGLGRNQVHGACCSVQMAHKPVFQTDNSRLELTVLIYTVLLYICTPLHLLYLMIWGIWYFKLVHKQPISNAILESHYKDTIFFKCFSTYVFSRIHCFSIFVIISYGS